MGVVTQLGISTNESFVETNNLIQEQVTQEMAFVPLSAGGPGGDIDSMGTYTAGGTITLIVGGGTTGGRVLVTGSYHIIPLR